MTGRGFVLKTTFKLLDEKNVRLQIKLESLAFFVSTDKC